MDLFQGVRTHDLRRTHATILIACGVSHKVVQERLGHKNISTTLALYAQGTELGHIDASNASLQFLKQGQTKDEIDSSDKAN